MAVDPTGRSLAAMQAVARRDPQQAGLGDRSAAFAAQLNDRQPDAEKSTPETEWRRIRDMWGALQRLGKVVVEAIDELSRDGLLGVPVEQKLGGIPEESADPYDPISGTVARGSGGSLSGPAPSGQGAGAGGVNVGIRKIREALAIAHRLAQDTADELADLSANVILKDGSVAFTGNQSMGSHKLTSVGAPIDAGDAVNKLYVDGMSTTLGQDNRRFQYSAVGR